MFLQRILSQAHKVNLGNLISGEYFYHKTISNCHIKKQAQHSQWSRDPTQQKQFIDFYLPTDLDFQSVHKINYIKLSVQQQLKSKCQINISKAKCIGDKFRTIQRLNTILGQQQVQLFPQPGQVLLINIWATWCDPCQQSMDQTQSMLSRNNWADRVKTVAISADRQKEESLLKIKKKGWDRFEHLSFGYWSQDHPSAVQFHISKLPHVILVDKFGTIRFNGIPHQCDIQQSIMSLLKQQKQNKQQLTQIGIAQNYPLRIEHIIKLIQILSPPNFIKSQFKQTGHVEIELAINGLIFKGKTAYRATIKLCINQQDACIEQQLAKLLPSKDVEIRTSFIRFEKIPKLPSSCVSCQKQIASHPVYWCKWAPNRNTFVCLNCVSNMKQKQNYILIMQPTQNIAATNMGKNIQPIAIEDKQLRRHQFVCNGCYNKNHKIGSARYVCLECNTKPQQSPDLYDLCEQCINQEIQESQQKQFEQNNQQSHVRGKHSFVRIGYNVQGYFIY